MSSDSTYVNNFTVSAQNLVCILDAKCTAPNIEKTGYNVPPVFDAHKIVDEKYLFMPINVAKELALSLMQVVGDMEKRSGIKIRLNDEKQGLWEAACQAIEEQKANNSKQ